MRDSKSNDSCLNRTEVIEAEVIEKEEEGLVKVASTGLEKLDSAIDFVRQALSLGRGISRGLGELGEMGGGVGQSLMDGNPVSKKQLSQMRPVEIEWTCPVCGYTDEFVLLAGLQLAFLDDEGQFSKSKFRRAQTCTRCGAPGDLTDERIAQGRREWG